MKNYRYIGRYTRADWENDIEWKAKRLQFLWDFSKLYSDDYSELQMYKEKNEFYRINNQDVGRLAAQMNGYAPGEFERYEKMKDEECVIKLIELIKLKRKNRTEFLKKNNSNLYFYLTENRVEDIRETLYYDYELRDEYNELFED